MKRRKPMVRYVVRLCDGGEWTDYFPSHTHALDAARGRGGKVVKLVEADPAADAVVRAALEVVAENRKSRGFALFEPEASLVRAVDRLEKRRGGKR